MGVNADHSMHFALQGPGGGAEGTAAGGGADTLLTGSSATRGTSGVTLSDGALMRGAEVVIRSRAQGASGAPREVFRGRADGDGNVLFAVDARGWHFGSATIRDRDGREHVTTLTFHVGGGR